MDFPRMAAISVSFETVSQVFGALCLVFIAVFCIVSMVWIIHEAMRD
jgi:hypothetical protein